MKHQRHHELPVNAQSLMTNAFTILVVDDIATNRLLLNRLLTRVGYQVIEAEDGEAALAQIERCQPDLVIFDVEMPGISGIETVSLFRSTELETDPLPIIVASGNPSDEMEENAMEAGADIFMTKPFDFPALLGEIRVMLRERRGTKTFQTKRNADNPNRVAANVLSVKFADSDH